jgi:pyrroloquinoline quinone biosynthesis protein D
MIHCPRLAGHARYRWDGLARQHLLLFPEGMLILNDAAAAIVMRCDGRPRAAIVSELCGVFTRARAEQIHALLDRLAAEGLIHDGA